MSMIVPPTLHTLQDDPRRVRVQASDTRFFAAFAGGYQAFLQAPATPLTDDGIYAVFHHTFRDPNLSAIWKAGRLAGWFAALYHIPCRFQDTATADTSPTADTYAPRPIELSIIERRFVSCYRDGYRQAARKLQGAPLTDEQIFAVLDDASSTYVFGRANPLSATRCCAGYLAGWFARFYGIRSLVDPSLAQAPGEPNPSAPAEPSTERQDQR
jgi:hypothetical protein